MADKATDPGAVSHPPRDDLVRAMPSSFEVRAAPEGGMPTMFGHFAVFNQWAEIDSYFEGSFLEQLAPGSFTKTFKENAKGIRSLFQHGRDPQVGDKPLGVIEVLREDDDGAYAEVRMLDTSYNRDIIPGIEAGQYGQSFRFRVMREEINEEPEVSDYNPKGLPERTIKEVHLMEFGPVTFPAYAGTDVGMRSLTDEYVYDLSPERIEQLRALITETPRETDTPPGPDAGAETTSERDDAGTPTEAEIEGAKYFLAAALRSADDSTSPLDDAGSASTSDVPERRPQARTKLERKETPMADNMTVDELEVGRANVHDRLKEIAGEVGTNIFTEAQRAEVETLKGQRDEFDARIAQDKAMRAIVADPEPKEREDIRDTFNVRLAPKDIYDLSTIRSVYDNPEMARQEFRDRAMKAVEQARYPEVGKRGSKEDMQSRVSHLLDTADSEDSVLARRVLTTGHPLYEGAFWKKLQGRHLSSAEEKVIERAALGQATAGYAVPFALDPTVSLISDGNVNPLRQVARVVTIAGETWKGVNSAGITASYDPEAEEASEDTPTLTQPTTTVLTARAFVPFSIESEDWVGLRAELTSEFQDAKDILEGNKFTLGTGSPDPQGIIVGATNLATTVGSAVVALADLDTLTDALPPRWQSNAVFMANRKLYSKIRQLDRAAGTNASWAPMREGFPAQLLGYPAYENSNIVGTVTTTASLVGVVGDFSQFIIVDRIGMSVELIPHIMGVAYRPTGQRGLFAFWRNTSLVRTAAAFRALKVL